MIISATFSIAHFFVNIFAGGRSTVKVVLFILFFAITAAVFFLKKDIFKITSKKISGLFWISVGLSYCWSLILFLYFSYIQRLSLFKYVLVMSNGEISSDIWYHSHVMKGVIGLILHYFGINTLENIDAGGAYVGLINNWFLVIGLFLLIVVLALTFLYVFYLRSQIGEKTVSQKILLSLIYSIGLFSLVRTIVDGGMFHPDAIISLAAVLSANYILNSPEKMRRLFSHKKIQICILIFTLISYVFIFGNFSYQIITSYLFILLMGTLFLSYLKAREALYFAALFAIFFFFGSGLDRDIWNYERLKIKKDEPVFVFSYTPPSGIFRAVKENSVGRGTLYSVVSEKDTDLGALAKNIGSLANIHPVAIPWKTCFPSGNRDIFSFGLHTKNNLPESLFKNMDSPVHLKLKEATTSKNWHDASIKADMDPCTPRALNVLDETIRESLGDTPYFLSDLTDERVN